MIEKRDIYKCEICGNVIEVLEAGAPALVCCGEDMKKLAPKIEDKGNEKHVPVLSETADGLLVKVGETEHPMEDDHYITMIEVLTKDKVLRAELEPGQKPEATFAVDLSDLITAREYCNVHGLWKIAEEV